MSAASKERSASAFLVVLGAASAIAYQLGADRAAGPETLRLFPALYYVVFALYLTALWWLRKHPGQSLVLIVGFAALFRVQAMQAPPLLSSDVYRYAWDGRVQRAGQSPYRFAPNAPELSELRDEAIHPEINRPAERTIYPPGAQLLFRLLPYRLDAVRGAMIGFDLLTIVLLIALLRRAGRDPAWALLYAWAPLSVLEVGNNGHLEAAVLPFLVGSALAHRAGRDGAAGALLGGAVSLKLYPVWAVVAVARKSPKRVMLALLVVLGLAYLLYLPGAGADILGFLPKYFGSAEDHNVGLRALLEWGLGSLFERPRAPAFVLCITLFASGLVVLWRRGAPVERTLLGVTGLYLLTLPTAFHPWYALWLLPWVAVHPRLLWLWLTGTLPLSYLKYAEPGMVMPSWIPLFELIPTVLLLGWEARRR